MKNNITRKSLFCLVAICVITNFFVNASNSKVKYELATVPLKQNCSILEEFDFSNVSTLPISWKEKNTKGAVYIKNKALVMERKKQNGSIRAPRLRHQIPTNIGEEFQVMFDLSSSKTTISNRIDFLSETGAFLLSLKVGDKGNILYAVSENGDKPKTFTDSHQLLSTPFYKNTNYNILLTFKASNQLTISVDGHVSAENIHLPFPSKQLSDVQFDFISAYKGTALFYLHHFRVNTGSFPTNIGLLQNTVSTIHSFLQNEVNVGKENGNYPKSVYKELVGVLNKAEDLLKNCASTPEDIEKYQIVLEEHFNAFKSSKIYPVTNISLTIDTKQVLSKKNPLWFGGNNIYSDAGQGLWDVENNAPDQKVLERAKYTGASFYRFPGGTMANLYKWKRAIGPLEQRKSNMNSHGKAGPESNEFGPDEFGKLLQTTFIDKGIMVVAFQYETPEDVADYVEYMNAKVGENPNGGIDWAAVRAKNGSYEPYNIKYWEIGNEVFGNWELSVFNYPADGDETRGGDNIIYGDAKNYVNGGSRAFTNQLACADTSWLASDCKTTGLPSQELYVKFAPVKLSEHFGLTINGKKWRRVKDFNKSSSSDKHYTVDGKTGKISFGDGVKGQIPVSGYNVVLDYTSGDHPSFSDYYNAIKSVDESITVISCYEKEKFYRLMAEKNLPFDGVAFHFYPNMSAKNLPDNELYKRSIWEGLHFKSKVNKHRKWLKKYPNQALKGKNIQLHLTEFGARNSLVSVPLVSSLWYNVVNDHPDVLGSALVHSYFKKDNTPLVDTRKSYTSARAHAYHMFTTLHQDTFVKVAYEGETYEYNKKTINNTYSTATISDDGKTITVVIPNTSDNKILNLSLNIENYPFVSSDNVRLTKWETKADSFLAKNSDRTPNEVTIIKSELTDVAASMEIKVPPFTTVVYQWSSKNPLHNR
ncbi:hypothetical protein [Flammeovirga agarivorans]|uniref:Alpha-L-arabinofuranosidase 1 catalytic domain-containing protein n=1 Tax=Flammeovirga agarivorans TaxID=2726742 RepID=A0A7X8XXU8_9BACT|nr:hypothetical protein [Flammeovirga agarivorans]NLR93468.1 hypothetical protein [Flammeovirga agarivorans]